MHGPTNVEFISFTSNFPMSLIMIPLPRYMQDVSIWFWCDVMSSWGLRLCWVVVQYWLVVVHRCGRTVYKSHLQGSAWLLKMGRSVCTETPANNYHPTLRNSPEERRFQLHRGGSLKSGFFILVFISHLTFKPRIKSHLLFAGIIRSSPCSPR